MPLRSGFTVPIMLCEKSCKNICSRYSTRFFFHKKLGLACSTRSFLKELCQAGDWLREQSLDKEKELEPRLFELIAW